jgi:hypothetical protein
MRRRGTQPRTGSAEAFGNVKVTLTASTAAKIVIWREDDLFRAQSADAVERSQLCLAVDLFEVIAELAGLDLEHREQAAEAISLAEHAQERLRLTLRPDAGDDDTSPSADRDTAS